MQAGQVLLLLGIWDVRLLEGEEDFGLCELCYRRRIGDPGFVGVWHW